MSKTTKTTKTEPGANFASVQQRTAERDQFDQFMARNVARLMDHAKPFVGRLPPLEAELFTKRALASAWNRRAELNPEKDHGLLLWWEGCLKAAALSRDWWRQVYQDDVKKVRGSDLGKV